MREEITLLTEIKYVCVQRVLSRVRQIRCTTREQGAQGPEKDARG